MALLLAEICPVSAIALTYQSNSYDPNYTPDDNVAYKQALRRLLTENHVLYVIDLHGAALNSPTLSPQQTIDLGLRQKDLSASPSMNLTHVEELERLLRQTEGECDSDCFVVERNRFPGAGQGTITSFACSQIIPGTDIHVQAIQIEMKPQVRIAHRLPTATLYKSCGPYDAYPTCVWHMLEALIGFIEYLTECKV